MKRVSIQTCILAAALGLALAAAPPAAFAQQAPEKPAAKPAAKDKRQPARQSATKSQGQPAAEPAGAAGKAPRFDSEVRNAILLDYQTGQVMFEKAADERIAPASMSKILTLYLAFDLLKKGQIGMDDTLAVGDRTWKEWNNRGSTMFIPARARVKVEDLLRGIIVQSGNDACVVLAEGLYGSEAAFAEAANRKAKELGLAGSNITNSTGWPDPNHYMTVRDLAILGKRIIEDFPEYYPMFKEKDFTFNGTRQGNRNPLLYKDTGADGIKTGHTDESGFGLAASAIRNGRRIIMVVHGLSNMKHRAGEAERLLDWGFRAFTTYSLFKPGDKVGEAEVWLGEKLKVPLLVEENVALTLAREARRDLKVQVVTEEPAPAPIRKGDKLGKLVIAAPGAGAREVPLVAGEDVDKLGTLARIGVSLGYVLLGPSSK
ncbi:MAG: D-alanyl-D-alanine carboxypeptidase family protein [Rhodospirillales bacterium]